MIRGSNLESSSNLSLNDFKVEESLKGSLDSILSPSPSVQIQIMGGKVCLRRKGKTLLGIVNKLFVLKICCQHPTMLFLNTFPAHDLNIH